MLQCNPSCEFVSITGTHHVWKTPFAAPPLPPTSSSYTLSIPFSATFPDLCKKWDSTVACPQLALTLAHCKRKPLLLRLRTTLRYGNKYLEGSLTTCLFNKPKVVGSPLGHMAFDRITVPGISSSWADLKCNQKSVGYSL